MSNRTYTIPSFILLAGLLLTFPSTIYAADTSPLKIISITPDKNISPGDSVTVKVLTTDKACMDNPVAVLIFSKPLVPNSPVILPSNNCTTEGAVHTCSGKIPTNYSPAVAELHAGYARLLPCQKDEPSEIVPLDIETKQSPLKIKTIPESLIIDRVGEQIRLEVDGDFSDGSTLKLNWSTRTKFRSDNTSVVTIDENGTVKAVGKGLATITVSYEDKNIKVPVSVDTVPIIKSANAAAFIVDAATVEKYRQAAEQGNAQAQYDLGMAYHNGTGVPKDDIEARKWWLKATEQRYSPAWSILCHYSVTERLSTPPNVDYPMITDFIAPVDVNMWRKWCSVSRPEENYSEYIPKLYSRAEQGDIIAQRNMGLAYQMGGFFAALNDSAKALPWFQLAADGGDAVSQRYLGIIYMRGQPPSFTPDYTNALKYFQKAAAQNDALSETYIGKIYSDGTSDTPKHYEEALKWYQMAANQNEPNAERKLGDMYANGIGVSQNSEEMVKWYSLAATHGDKIAALTLGTDYAKGTGGVHQDDKAAYKWLSLAGEPGAGLMTTMGFAPLDTSIVKGTPPTPADLEKSYMWLKAASLLGDKKAADRMAEITKGMNATQIAEAENMYRDLTSTAK
jgi:TPR repeat protein